MFSVEGHGFIRLYTDSDIAVLSRETCHGYSESLGKGLYREGPDRRKLVSSTLRNLAIAHRTSHIEGLGNHRCWWRRVHSGGRPALTRIRKHHHFGCFSNGSQRNQKAIGRSFGMCPLDRRGNHQSRTPKIRLRRVA